MHDFSVVEPEDMNFKVLADAAGYYKKDKEGIQAMCKAMEDMIAEFVTDEKKSAAFRMLKRGKMTYEEITEDLELSLEIIKNLAKDMQIV